MGISQRTFELRFPGKGAQFLHFHNGVKWEFVLRIEFISGYKLYFAGPCTPP